METFEFSFSFQVYSNNEVTELTSMSDFEPVWSYDHGLCSTIFPQLPHNQSLINETTHGKFEKYARDIPKGAKAGWIHASFILVDTETYDYRYSLFTQPGIRLTIHHHLDIPITWMDGITLTPGQGHEIAITPILHKTSERAIKRFSPHERQCDEESDITYQHIKYPYRKSLKNCLFEAIIQETIKQCQCSPSFVEPTPEYPACKGYQLDCVDQTKFKMGSLNKVSTICNMTPLSLGTYYHFF